jgi:ABC-type dipeptide/oligopeptide/nickel transport system permease subunit
MMLSVVGAVVAEGFASWFGQTANRLTWGTIVYYGVTFRNAATGLVAWHAILPPAIALSLFSAAFYLVSVGLREVADPRIKAVRRP